MAIAEQAPLPLLSPASGPLPPSLPLASAPTRPPSRRRFAMAHPAWRLTLAGRCVALLGGELVANCAVWVAAACVFAPDRETRGVLSLCVVAWTLGLRHGLDMDHIVAVDTTTRSLVSVGQTPVTVGLFFSLGHSTIVLAMTVAIIITTAAIDKLPDVSSVGGVIGVSVSASFLFLLAVINAVMLWQTVRLARRRKQLRAAAAAIPPRAGPALTPEEADLVPTKKRSEDEEATFVDDNKHSHTTEPNGMEGLPATTCIGRVGRPLFRLIDKPWKAREMYPVGVLFGLGFDTAASISLLGISALAGSGEHRIPPGQIILLPLLFTAGMTAVDSADSVFMLAAYTLPQRAAAREAAAAALEEDVRGAQGAGAWYDPRRWVLIERRPTADERQDEVRAAAERARMLPQANEDKLVNISVVLTVISIVVALLISVTEFMGLALEKCGSCADAAENDPGLSGRWWRFWAAVNDNSGYLGAGVVALFALVFGGWAVVHFVGRARARREGKRTAVE